jgi:hypothetical protein
MSVLGDMTKYTQFQFADALKAGAENPSGGHNSAGDAMGMGIGFAMAGQMAAQMAGQQAGAGAPPPVPNGQKMYFVAVNGQQTGPFSVPELQQKAVQGQLTAQSLVWAQGMAAWATASSVAELSQLFVAVPPPIPPVS